MAQELQHEITIGPSPLAAARVQAALVHGDIESGQTELPGAHVKYEDKPGKDQSLSPPQLNAEGKGNCASIPRAVAPFADASHMAVTPVHQADGSVVHHTFIIADAKPGEAPIHIGPDGRAISPIPPERIIDPNVGHGMNNGEPLPPAVYQNAALAPIAPPGVVDLSHVHADPADRAAEGKAHQGLARLHTPTTEPGVAVAVASHLAARTVDPHPQAEPRTVEGLYLADPKKAEAERAAFPWTPTKRMVAQFVTGLREVAAGANPAPLPGDPAVKPEHQEAAAQLLEHVKTLATAQLPSVPEADKTAAIDKLAADAHRLETADRKEPAHDVHATVIAEVDAMLPGMTPTEITKPLASKAPAVAAIVATARTQAKKRRDLFATDHLDFFSIPGDGDRGASLDLPMSAALTAGLAGGCHEHLRKWRVGCPGDGHRCARPARKPLDARMGAIGDILGNIFTGGLYGAVKAGAGGYQHADEWRKHHEGVEHGRRDWERRRGGGGVGGVGGGGFERGGLGFGEHREHRFGEHRGFGEHREHMGGEHRDRHLGAWWEKHEGPEPGGGKPHGKPHHKPADAGALVKLVPVDPHVAGWRGWRGNWRDRRHVACPPGHYRNAAGHCVPDPHVGGHGGYGHGGGGWHGHDRYAVGMYAAPELETADLSFFDDDDPKTAGPGEHPSSRPAAGYAGASAGGHTGGGHASAGASGGSGGHTGGSGAPGAAHPGGAGGGHAGAGGHGGGAHAGAGHEGGHGGHAGGGGHPGGHGGIPRPAGGHPGEGGWGGHGENHEGHGFEGARGGFGRGSFGEGGWGRGGWGREGWDRGGFEGEQRWRDRWGVERTGPIVESEWVSDIDAPVVVDTAPVVPPVVPIVPVREPWWKRFFHFGANETHFGGRGFGERGFRDHRFGGIINDDDGPPRPARPIKCACG